MRRLCGTREVTGASPAKQPRDVIRPPPLDSLTLPHLSSPLLHLALIQSRPVNIRAQDLACCGSGTGHLGYI